MDRHKLTQSVHCLFLTLSSEKSACVWFEPEQKNASSRSLSVARLCQLRSLSFSRHACTWAPRLRAIKIIPRWRTDWLSPRLPLTSSAPSVCSHFFINWHSTLSFLVSLSSSSTLTRTQEGKRCIKSCFNSNIPQCQ